MNAEWEVPASRQGEFTTARRTPNKAHIVYQRLDGGSFFSECMKESWTHLPGTSPNDTDHYCKRCVQIETKRGK